MTDGYGRLTGERVPEFSAELRPFVQPLLGLWDLFGDAPAAIAAAGARHQRSAGEIADAAHRLDELTSALQTNLAGHTAQALGASVHTVAGGAYEAATQTATVAEGLGRWAAQCESVQTLVCRAVRLLHRLADATVSPLAGGANDLPRRVAATEDFARECERLVIVCGRAAEAAIDSGHELVALLRDLTDAVTADASPKHRIVVHPTPLRGAGRP